MANDTTFGKRLHAARISKGLSQKQIAVLAGMAQPTISELEQDHYEGSAYAPELAAALGVEALWLKTGKGPRKRGDAVLDADLLKDVLEALEVGAEGRSLAPQRRAELAVALYTMFSKTSRPEPGDMLQFLRSMLV